MLDAVMYKVIIYQNQRYYVMNKKIIVNGQSLNEKETYGIQRNTLHILKELDKIIDKGDIQLVTPSWGKDGVEFKNIEVVQVKAPNLKRMRRFVWSHILFPLYVCKKRGVGMDMMLALPMFGCKIVFIYDCIMELFPQNFITFREKIGRKFYMFRARHAIKKSELIITDSKSAKNDIIRLYHCPREKIKVVYCGWQHFVDVKEDLYIMDRLNLVPGKYCFSLGSRYYHKNYKWIIYAAKQNPQYIFVIAGTNSLISSDSVLGHDIPSNVIFTGYLKDSELKTLMKNCKVFIQPSLYEGFGIPPMEAMSVGTRCIVSNVASLPEIYGDSVWYIDPKNYDDIDIDRIMSRSIDDIQRILDKYSWGKSAVEIKSIIRNMLK